MDLGLRLQGLRPQPPAADFTYSLLPTRPGSSFVSHVASRDRPTPSPALYPRSVAKTFRRRAHNTLVFGAINRPTDGGARSSVAVPVPTADKRQSPHSVTRRGSIASSGWLEDAACHERFRRLRRPPLSRRSRLFQEDYAPHRPTTPNRAHDLYFDGRSHPRPDPLASGSRSAKSRLGASFFELDLGLLGPHRFSQGHHPRLARRGPSCRATGSNYEVDLARERRIGCARRRWFSSDHTSTTHLVSNNPLSGNYSEFVDGGRTRPVGVRKHWSRKSGKWRFATLPLDVRLSPYTTNLRPLVALRGVHFDGIRSLTLPPPGASAELSLDAGHACS